MNRPQVSSNCTESTGPQTPERAAHRPIRGADQTSKKCRGGKMASVTQPSVLNDQSEYQFWLRLLPPVSMTSAWMLCHPLLPAEYSVSQNAPWQKEVFPLWSKRKDWQAVVRRKGLKQDITGFEFNRNNSCHVNQSEVLPRPRGAVTSQMTSHRWMIRFFIAGAGTRDCPLFYSNLIGCGACCYTTATATSGHEPKAPDAAMSEPRPIRTEVSREISQLNDNRVQCGTLTMPPAGGETTELWVCWEKLRMCYRCWWGTIWNK